MDRGEIVVLDAPEALKASVGADRVVLGTVDESAALVAQRDRFDVTVAEGADLPRRLRRGERPRPMEG